MFWHLNTGTPPSPPPATDQVPKVPDASTPAMFTLEQRGRTSFGFQREWLFITAGGGASVREEKWAGQAVEGQGDGSGVYLFLKQLVSLAVLLRA